MRPGVLLDRTVGEPNPTAHTTTNLEQSFAARAVRGQPAADDDVTTNEGGPPNGSRAGSLCSLDRAQPAAAGRMVADDVATGSALSTRGTIGSTMQRPIGHTAPEAGASPRSAAMMMTRHRDGPGRPTRRRARSSLMNSAEEGGSRCTDRRQRSRWPLFVGRADDRRTPRVEPALARARARKSGEHAGRAASRWWSDTHTPRPPRHAGSPRRAQAGRGHCSRRKGAKSAASPRASDSASSPNTRCARAHGT